MSNSTLPRISRNSPVIPERSRQRDGTLPPVEEALQVLLNDVGVASRATPVDRQQLLPLLADIYEQKAELTGDRTAFEAGQAARSAAGTSE